MSEETALEPVLERPLANLVCLGNFYAFAGFKGDWFVLLVCLII